MTRSRGISQFRGLRGSLEDRFWQQVVRTDEGCWGWRGAKTALGYGVLGKGSRSGGNILAHRASWTIHNGEIPPALCVLHHCDNPPCTRPDHLWLGTRVDNNRDMALKGRARGAGPIGEAHGMARLTWEQVGHIRASAAVGRSAVEIAPTFGMSVAHVRRIIQGRAWRVG